MLTGKQMTLSHCWGNSKCLKLTTGNYNKLLNGIPLASLPKLYQDAVYAVRQLNIRYLWIDSLCIIQEGDNFKDWEHEVTKMSEVYSNSFCNISAAAAPDGTYSMFNFRDPGKVLPETIDFTDGISQESRPYLITDTYFWKSDVTNAYINRRAWVLQERLLSLRNLHFGESQLAWECREMDASETYPAGLPYFIKTENPRMKSTFDFTKKNGMFDTDLVFNRPWGEIVTAYTRCNLTFPSDKLVAISAIARRMRSTTQDQYIAGLWRRNLENQLLWFHTGDTEPRPKIYRAPTVS